MVSKPKNPSQSTVPTIVLAVAGTVLVWYDYYLFGSLASIIAPHFFPKSLTELTLFGYGCTFLLALFIRPAGGVLFGLIADRRGRRAALTFTFLFAGLSTMLVGSFPAFDAVG